MPSGEVIQGYGFLGCAAIASNNRRNTVINADNYAIFALAVTLSQIDWTISDPPGAKP
jgi:hypothetical protein